ncbi:MAG: Spy/CpxP family protein refolding chaperone [Deltaproteobacteria bacterium]|nr:Spy/CpxP family protein refolding chaperone [Deltaproteobacteria bacterium]
MKKILVLSIFLLLALLVNGAIAGPGGEGMARGERSTWFKDLNLTEEQRGKIQSLRQSLRDDILHLRNEMIKKRTELSLLWMEDNLDAAKIKAKQREIRELRAKMEDRLTDFRLEFRKILTPEQREKVLSLKSRRGSRRPKGERPGAYQEMRLGPAWQ